MLKRCQLCFKPWARCEGHGRPNQNEDVINYAKALYEAIEMAGDRGVPSGHLYAVLMDRMNLATYEALLSLLIEGGLISQSNHLLKATPR
jgi:hypothetical protein